MFSLTTMAEGYSERMLCRNCIASDFVLKLPAVTLKYGLEKVL